MYRSIRNPLSAFRAESDSRHYVNNDAFMVCSAKSYTLEDAQTLCDASDDCRALHDYACDGKNWRYCETSMATILAAGSSTAACTKKKSVCEDFSINIIFSGASGTSYGSIHSSTTHGTGFGIEDNGQIPSFLRIMGPTETIDRTEIPNRPIQTEPTEPNQLKLTQK